MKRILKAFTKGQIIVICIDEYDEEFSLITGKAGDPELTIKTYNLSLENDELSLRKVKEQRF